MRLNIFRKNPGAFIAPGFIVFFYYLFVFLDLFTTYLATPDLKYEGNWMVRRYNLNWAQIFLLVTSGAVTLSMLYIISVRYIYSYFKHEKNSTYIIFFFKISPKIKFWIGVLIIGYFYKHLFYSIFISINNYLGYIYVNNIQNWLNNIARYYIDFTIIGSPFFYPITHLLFLLIAYYFIWLKLKTIKASIVKELSE